jgi:hypothetical protein
MTDQTIATADGVVIAETRHIDLTPTWAGVLPGLLAVIANGETVEAQQAAEHELLRMARLADLHLQIDDDVTQPGARLSNGATVIALRATGYEEGIVLALTMKQAAHPYATWRISLRDGTTTSGHYIETIEEAMEDYRTR